MKPFTGFSYIICHRETDDISETIESIKSASQNIPYEIISATGNHPTHQRNHAAKEAIYSHLYFLDDDSIVNKESIDTLIFILKNNEWEKEKISLIGGPALLKQPANFFEECVDSVLSSRAVVGKIRARYSKVGESRFSNDQEMILCNLIIEKENFNQLEKFDTKLYPNEENDFIYRLLFAQQENQENTLGKVLYHPDICVHRPQRNNLKSYIKQMFTYGRGRAEQTKNSFKTLHFHLLLAIPFFLLFLISITAVIMVRTFGWQFFDSVLPALSKYGLTYMKTGVLIFSNLLLGYFLYTLYILVKKSSLKKRLLLYIPVLIFSSHFFYGMGLLIGFFKSGFVSDKKKVVYQINKISR